MNKVILMGRLVRDPEVRYCLLYTSNYDSWEDDEERKIMNY